MGWLANSRKVLEIKDEKKLYELLAEQRAELFKLNTGFGQKKMGAKTANNLSSNYRKTKKNIARIMTRINQLKQQVKEYT